MRALDDSVFLDSGRSFALSGAAAVAGEGWIAGEWGRTESNRRARYDQLTAAGRKQYRSVSGAIGKVLEPA